MYQFKLEKYTGSKSRHTCPKCSHPNQFTLYVDYDGKALSPIVGKCNRINNCAYHYTPKEFYNKVGHRSKTNVSYSHEYRNRKQETSETDHYIPIEWVRPSLRKYENNILVNFLIEQFGPSVTKSVISKYNIGTSKHWDGATIFWYLDHEKRANYGKIMSYEILRDDSKNLGLNCKRIKERITHVGKVLSTKYKAKNLDVPTWLSDYNKSESKINCLFGAHLFEPSNTNPIGIVESEKTAIIASVFHPEYTWMATGGIANLKESTIKVLKDKRIILFPDLNAYDLWNQKAKSLTHISEIIVSSLLQKNVSKEEGLKGYDLADYLLMRNIKDYKPF